ncbi:TPA: plasmid stabilization protein, partial [Escherichia coli]
MNSTTHYENANFLRELAESLPRIFPEGSTDKSALLQRLANEELA